MNKRLEEEIRTFLSNNRITNPINTTLTERQFCRGIAIDSIRSERNFRYFRNKLNTRVFGNSYRRFGKQLQMLVVREISPDKRHHLHCIIQQPARFETLEFMKLIKTTWSSTDFGYEQVHIEKPSSQQRKNGWLNYILKDYSKVSLDHSIDWMNSSFINYCRL